MIHLVYSRDKLMVPFLVVCLVLIQGHVSNFVVGILIMKITSFIVVDFCRSQLKGVLL